MIICKHISIIVSNPQKRRYCKFIYFFPCNGGIFWDIFCRNGVTVKFVMKKRLKDLAVVQTGYSFRSRLESTEKGNVSVIQMKDLNDDNVVLHENLTRVKIEEVKEHHFVKQGDLIFRSRGLAASAVVVQGALPDTIVAAPLLRIRVIKQKVVLPEYLNWYLRQWDAQAFLVSRADGTFQRMITKETLECLDVILPKINKQKSIVELAGLAAREECLYKAIAEKKMRCVSARLMRFVKETK